MNTKRIRVLNDVPSPANGEYVLYWMQSAQRITTNHALFHAIRIANRLKLPLRVLFVVAAYPDANARHYHFMLEGLKETVEALETRGAEVIFQVGSFEKTVAAQLLRAAHAVFDDAAMPFMAEMKSRLATQAATHGVPVELVTTNLIVPLEALPATCEYAARTLRPKLWRKIDSFIDPVELDALVKKRKPRGIFIDADAIIKRLQIDTSITKTSHFTGGEGAAQKRLKAFVDHGLKQYDASSNPGSEATSQLSPYLHFGHVSPLDAFLAVEVKQDLHRAEVEAFQEQLLVRRELAFNFAKRCEGFDRFETMTYGWAYDTLKAHEDDEREAVYTLEDYHNANTHDPYFNAAMNEMIHTGYMHNTMRMYWGKRIIAWSKTARDAYETIIALNNAYFLDGRDPVSYASVAWLFGRHDRGFPSQPVFGKVRSMTAGGLKRKYDMDAYLARIKKNTPS